MNGRCVAVNWVVCFGFASLHLAAGDLYTRRPTGGQVWEAKDINEKGEMVGNSGTAYFFNGSETVYTLGLASTNSGFSALNGLNNLGLAVGASTVGTNHPGPLRAFSLDTKTGVIRDLGSLGGANGESQAYAVNDAGLVVGMSALAESTNAVRFETDGRITDLGTLGGWWSAAVDMNEKGDIAGTSLDAEGRRRAFLIPASGSMTDLGTLGGSESWATRINNNGEVVGGAKTADGITHAFLYKDGKMIDLGTLGGESVAFGINDEGTIVGWSWGGSGGDWTAFIRYPGGPMRDLAEMASVAAGDDLFRAKAINNRGEIAVSVFHPTYRTGVEFPSLLKPGAVSGQVKNGKFELRIAAPTGKEARLESSADLREWLEVLTVVGEGEKLQQEGMEAEANFYRLVVE